MDYRQYTVTDFLHDELFRKWIIHPEHDTTVFWETWLRENPDHRTTVEQARDVLLLIGPEEYMPTEDDKTEVWSRIAYSIRQAPERKRMFVSWRYAAAFAGVLIASATGWYLFNRPSPVMLNYATAYGEVRKITLPDSSVVRMNANSTLRFAMDASGKREVWLDGECFFTILPEHSNAPFAVHTSDVDVKVIGTEFNVNTRRVMTRVVLNNGAVRLKLNGEDQPEVSMRPGEMVTFSTKTNQLSRQKVNPADYNAWLDNMFVFNEATIAEVAAVLNENLGINIKIEDQELRKELFTGSIPMSGVEIFFKTLSRSLHVVIEKKDNNNYSIRRKKT
ncbi:FecR domain-containing protein [Chitinophaga rhizophila]|uniref:FecR domain-containing protein n=1 Tax=Chitinophaga rhizophila TaxID=2866212 RepID=A0ABS7GFJ8_9BACT|nr:FecR domain-containing protein [Chitinophaga rhizophila]MBW8686456.1 FecR domain-containing protein [Chitinophaga rhizophila]